MFDKAVLAITLVIRGVRVCVFVV